MFRRTLGRFSILYVAEVEGEVVGFIVARLKRVPEYLGGVMVGELKDMWVEHNRCAAWASAKSCCAWRSNGAARRMSTRCEAQILLGNEPIIKLVEYLGMKKELYQFRMSWEGYNQG